MKYLSLCSGIEAATVAWHKLGWKAFGFSEIEAFPSAVLKHHWPEVPNLGDMTKFADWQNLHEVDLLVGGTPCQSWSNAGLKKGKNDPRGQLTFCFLEIIGLVQPKWVVWENVPGILSDKSGAFVEFLDEILRLGYYLNCDILDAQFFLLPQRRRRIFLACQRADILMRQKTNTSATIGATMFAGILHDILDAHLAEFAKERVNSGVKCESVAAGLPRKTKPFAAHGEELLNLWLTNCAEAWLSVANEPRYSESEVGDGTNTETDSKTNGATWSLDSYLGRTDQTAGELFLNTSESLKKCLADLFVKANAYTTSTESRVITDLPISLYVNLLLIIENFTRHSATSCPHSLKAESLILTTIQKAITYARQSNRKILPDAPIYGFWADFTRQAERHCSPFASSGINHFCKVLPISKSVRRDIAPSRETGQAATGDTGTGFTPSSFGAYGEGVGTLRSSGGDLGGGSETLAVCNKQRIGEYGEGDIASTVADGEIARSLTARHDSSPCADRGQNMVAIQGALINRKPENGPQGSGHDESGVMYTLTKTDVHAVAYGFNGDQSAKTRSMGEREEQAPTLRSDGPAHVATAFAFDGYDQTLFDTSQTIRSDKSDGDHVGMVQSNFQVRRLSTVECHRLQGFHDDHCKIPRRGKPAEECPDSPQYKALGNSMAVPCMEFIGKRIDNLLFGDFEI